MSNVLALRTVDKSEWEIMLQQAAMLVKTGFLPEAIKTPEQAVAIMLKGRELQIPAMYALSNIAVIHGKPVANAELMLALVLRDHGDEAMEITESTNERCTVSYRRRGASQRRQYAFTIQDATKAGLMQGATWQHYPAAMLRARCISAVARMAFPDSIAGMYTAEELGATVTINDQGETEVQTMPDVISVQPNAPANGPSAQPKTEPAKPHPTTGQPGARIVQESSAMPQSHLCAECIRQGKPSTITEYQTERRLWTPDNIAAATAKEYNEKLCWKHWDERFHADKARQEQAALDRAVEAADSGSATARV